MNEINALRERLDILRNTIRERESSCIYGTPEVMERYSKETKRMREEAAELEFQLMELENQ